MQGAALAGLARCDEAAGDLELAGERFAEVLETARNVGEPGLIATALEGLARMATARGDREGVQRLMSEAVAVRSATSRPAPPYERRDLELLAFSGSSS